MWLQLVRGGLVETLNKKTGYSSFSGYKLGCLPHSARPSDFTSVSLEDLEEVAQSLDEESLENLDQKKHNIDRNGNKPPSSSSSSYPDRYNSDKWPSRPSYPERPSIYKDKHIFDAFNYNSDSSRGQLRPAHRPFHDNGPAIIDKEYVSRPNRYNLQNK